MDLLVEIVFPALVLAATIITIANLRLSRQIQSNKERLAYQQGRLDAQPKPRA